MCTRVTLRFLTAALLSAFLLLPRAVMPAQVSQPDYWPQWRGPEATGVAPDADPPATWSETANIRWKVPIPGRGSGSPIVWGDKVFVLTAVSDTGQAVEGVMHHFIVMALDRATGEVVWRQVAREEAPHEATHRQNGTYASASPVTDGEVLIANFESRGMYAYDLDGNLIWSKDLGDKHMRNQFGEGSTPALHGNTLVHVWDQLGGQSFVIALDKRTGEELWRRDREEIDTWATPLIVEVNGRAQAIVPAMERIESYDLETGEIVWESDGLTMNVIPSPVYEDGLAILMSGYRGNAVKAIDLSKAHGDITGTDAIVWSYDRDTPYVPSPLLYDGILYMLKSNNGILTAFNARTGDIYYGTQRLDGIGEVFSSPVGAGGRVYITSRDGHTLVLRNGETFEVLGSNSLDDGFDASPAIAGGEIYMRGYNNLYCIAED
ncbi:MAG: PQQ-binding-like beta-propeller repeat protein [Acidobacteriota bacterium]|jgi:outer membrane protein assembly factor BamB